MAATLSGSRLHTDEAIIMEMHARPPLFILSKVFFLTHTHKDPHLLPPSLLLLIRVLSLLRVESPNPIAALQHRNHTPRQSQARSRKKGRKKKVGRKAQQQQEKEEEKFLSCSTVSS